MSYRSNNLTLRSDFCISPATIEQNKNMLSQQKEHSKNCNLDAVQRQLRELIKDEEVLKNLLKEQRIQQLGNGDVNKGCVLRKEAGLPKEFRKLLRNMKMSQSSQTCSICMEGFAKGQIIKRLPCGHILHRECGKTWFKMNVRCPICRFDLYQHFASISTVGKEEKQETQTETGDKSQY